MIEEKKSNFNPRLLIQMDRYQEHFQWMVTCDFEKLLFEIAFSIEFIRREGNGVEERPEWKRMQDAECEHILWNLYTALNAVIMLKSHFEMATAIENMEKKIKEQGAELRELKAPEKVAKVLMGEEKSGK